MVTGLCRLEAMLCNAEVNLSEFDDVLRLYGNDFNQERLATQLRVLHTNLPSEIENEKGGVKLKSIVKFLQCLLSWTARFRACPLLWVYSACGSFARIMVATPVLDPAIALAP